MAFKQFGPTAEEVKGEEVDPEEVEELKVSMEASLKQFIDDRKEISEA